MCLGLKITGHKNISVSEKFRLEQGPLKTGFTVLWTKEALDLILGGIRVSFYPIHKMNWAMLGDLTSSLSPFI
jgi:hypothetical protein